MIYASKDPVLRRGLQKWIQPIRNESVTIWCPMSSEGFEPMSFVGGSQINVGDFVFLKKLLQLRMPLLHAEDESGTSDGHITSHVQEENSCRWVRVFERHRGCQVIATLDELT
jgi:hypothetical protein